MGFCSAGLSSAKLFGDFYKLLRELVDAPIGRPGEAMPDSSPLTLFQDLTQTDARSLVIAGDQHVVAEQIPPADVGGAVVLAIRWLRHRLITHDELRAQWILDDCAPNQKTKEVLLRLRSAPVVTASRLAFLR